MTFLQDTFTDPDNTLLENHVADVGGQWVNLGFARDGLAPVNTIHIDSPPDVVQTSTDSSSAGCAIHRSPAVPTSAEYDITFRLSFTTAAANMRWTVYFRMSDLASPAFTDLDFYGVDFKNDQSPQVVEISRTQAGTETVLATATTTLASSVVNVTIEVRNTVKRVLIDAVEVVSTTDNAITQAGRIGLHGRRGHSSNWIDDLTATVTGAISVVGATESEIATSVDASSDWSEPAPGTAWVPVGVASETDTGLPVIVNVFSSPTGLTATAVGETQVDLAWNPVAGASGYDVERDGVIIVHGHPATSYSDTGLNVASGYGYRVRAVR